MEKIIKKWNSWSRNIKSAIVISAVIILIAIIF